MVKWSTCEKVMMLRFEPKWLLKPSMKIFNPKKFKKQIKEIIKLEVIPAY